MESLISRYTEELQRIIIYHAKLQKLPIGFDLKLHFSRIYQLDIFGIIQKPLEYYKIIKET